VVDPDDFGLAGRIDSAILNVDHLVACFQAAVARTPRVNLDPYCGWVGEFLAKGGAGGDNNRTVSLTIRGKGLCGEPAYPRFFKKNGNKPYCSRDRKHPDRPSERERFHCARNGPEWPVLSLDTSWFEGLIVEFGWPISIPCAKKDKEI
jgi:hypothetical protein